MKVTKMKGKNTGINMIGLWVAALMLACAEGAEAATIVSNTFTQRLGFLPNGTWSTTEAAPTNVGVTTSSFSLALTASSSLFTYSGPTFINGVLATGTNSNAAGKSSDFLLTITGNYTGTVQTGYSTVVVIDSISIYGLEYPSLASGTGLQWEETTTGNIATSPLTTLVNTNATATASSYTLVSWKPNDVGTLGQTATRTFALITDGASTTTPRVIDGLAVTGHIEYLAVVPEPGVVSLTALGAAGLLLIVRRKTIDGRA